MDWNLNASQKAVLGWLCTSPESPPPSDSWKHAARALQGRGLVSVSRAGGKYSVNVTDVGRHMHEHGEYPVDSAGGRQTRRTGGETASGSASGASRPARTTKAARPKPMVASLPVLNPELASKRFLRPHPAVKALRDRPSALPSDAGGRQRGLLAVDLLVSAAAEAGFKVTAHEQPRKRTPGSPYTGEPLVTLNAGNADVVVRIGEYERQTEHVKTPDELERERRYGYSWSHRWDYVPTGLICFLLYTRLGTPIRLNETGVKPLHEFVPRVIRRVQLASQKELELKAAQQERRRREDERKEAARVLSERREHYQRWEKVLLDGADTWERAKQLRSFVAKLEAENGSEASDFIAWAGEYISQLDPVVQFEPPEGGVPDLDHEQEAHLRRQPVPGLSEL